MSADDVNHAVGDGDLDRDALDPVTGLDPGAAPGGDRAPADLQVGAIKAESAVAMMHLAGQLLQRRLGQRIVDGRSGGIDADCDRRRWRRAGKSGARTGERRRGEE